jgi:hypothetical protein
MSSITFRIRRAAAIRAAVSACLVFASLSCAVRHSDGQILLDNFIWEKDVATNKDIAISRGRTPVNYIVVGDLSQFSLYLTNQYINMLSRVAGFQINRNLGSYSIAVIHDSKVFDRLKNDNKSFGQLGIAPNAIDIIAANTPDNAKCRYSTFTDDNHEIKLSIILLSEQFNECLVSGLFRAFGVMHNNNDFSSIMSVCLLYQALSIEKRTREVLSNNDGALIEQCTRKALGRD